MKTTVIHNIIKNMDAEQTHRLISFEEFIHRLENDGELIFRTIFQLFHDMVLSYITEAVDEYEGDSESIGFLRYNLDELFINDTRVPFFADRLFANRLINLAKSFRMSAAPNKIYIFKGPAGSGKSTFLNNLLNKLEQYVRSDNGILYEVVWRIPRDLAEGLGAEKIFRGAEKSAQHSQQRFFEVPCPNHDNPFLMVPGDYRSDLISETVKQDELKKKLFKHKQYQWIFQDEPCTICASMFDALREKFSIEQVFSMVYSRRYLFNRKNGIGVSLFNSGDEVEKTIQKTNEQVQQFLNGYFNDSNKVRYLFSSYASTNQGIRALMDLKSRNIQRFLDLHGIISDEVHKVGDIEERIKSMFVVLMNPEDLDNIKKNESDGTAGRVDTSLKDRIHEILVPYVLDYNTEIRIYTNTYGEQIKLRFMPHVLENFARTIISSRIKNESRAIKSWIKNSRAYSKYCDPDFHILKMDLYTGIIPEWLQKEDRIALKAEVRKNIIAESEAEGQVGFSGRESLHIFNDFYTKYSRKRPITMHHIREFFLDENRHYKGLIPRDFLRHLTDLYDFVILKEVKDSIYSYNEEEISRSILNYLVAIVQNIGETIKNPYLNHEEFEVTTDFLDIVETHLIGYNASSIQKSKLREEAIAEYASVTLAKEIKCEGKAITETKQYLDMFAQFTKTARENVLEPYIGNSNFRCAIKEFESPDFDKYDTKIREKVSLLFRNLNDKYQYSTDCARIAVLHVFDNDLVTKFK